MSPCIKVRGVGGCPMNEMTRVRAKTNTRSKKISNEVVRCPSPVKTGWDRRMCLIDVSSSPINWTVRDRRSVPELRPGVYGTRGNRAGSPATVTARMTSFSTSLSATESSTTRTTSSRGRNEAGQVLFLEKGNSRSGLQHILEGHAKDFANVGVRQDKIAKLVFTAAATGKVVGTQGTRPAHEVFVEEKLYKIAVTVSRNGYTVGANPGGH